MPAPDLETERQAVEAAIRAAFAGVDRAGGVSWTEADVIDDWGTDEERAEARALDKERSWESLVDDPTWDHEIGGGRFSFLDPIGFRYYMAPAMIRCARSGHGEFTSYALSVDGNFKRRLVSLFTPAQASATARFIRYMIRVDSRSAEDPLEEWKIAYRLYWKDFDRGSPRAEV